MESDGHNSVNHSNILPEGIQLPLANGHCLPALQWRRLSPVKEWVCPPSILMNSVCCFWNLFENWRFVAVVTVCTQKESDLLWPTGWQVWDAWHARQAHLGMGELKLHFVSFCFVFCVLTKLEIAAFAIAYHLLPFVCATYGPDLASENEGNVWRCIFTFLFILWANKYMQKTCKKIALQNRLNGNNSTTLFHLWIIGSSSVLPQLGHYRKFSMSPEWNRSQLKRCAYLHHLKTVSRRR